MEMLHLYMYKQSVECGLKELLDKSITKRTRLLTLRSMQFLRVISKSKPQFNNTGETSSLTE